MNRSYSELMSLTTFQERFKYLQIAQKVADLTFGGYRNLNQDFYSSKQWKDIRYAVVVRDKGFDLAIPDYPIYAVPVIHHINPITVDMLIAGDYSLALDMENLILTSHRTHNAIHYGKESPYSEDIVRRPNDTCPWKN